jgi:hypothetical protein
VNERKRTARTDGRGDKDKEEEEEEEGDDEGVRVEVRLHSPRGRQRKQNERHRDSSLATRANLRLVGAIRHTSRHERNEKM